MVCQLVDELVGLDMPPGVRAVGLQDCCGSTAP
jgi:hypothetical protein